MSTRKLSHRDSGDRIQHVLHSRQEHRRSNTRKSFEDFEQGDVSDQPGAVGIVVVPVETCRSQAFFELDGRGHVQSGDGIANTGGDIRDRHRCCIA